MIKNNNYVVRSLDGTTWSEKTLSNVREISF